MKLLIASLALTVVAAPVLAQVEDEYEIQVDYDSKEYKFASCVNERDQSLLYAMRDAASVEAFQEAAAKAYALCEVDMSESFSMGKFFNAVASFIGKPTYEDAESQD